MRSLYDILGVDRSASASDIKKAYRKLAREYHPDRNKASDAEAKFKEVNRAHEVLSDADKRKLYDQFGEASLKPGFDPEVARGFGGFGGGRGGFATGGAGFDVDDLLGSLFGGGLGGGGLGGGFPGGSARQSPSAMRAELSIDFRTAVLGGERELSFSHGAQLKVRIPPGVRDGGTLRLRGKAPGGGDLLLTVNVAPDPEFRRDGDDLHVTVPVTIGEALLGASIEAPTLDGQVRLTVPPASQNGRRLRLRGKGVVRRNRAPGDLYVTLEVRLPDTLDDEARAAIRTLEKAYGVDVRTTAAA